MIISIKKSNVLEPCWIVRIYQVNHRFPGKNRQSVSTLSVDNSNMYSDIFSGRGIQICNACCADDTINVRCNKRRIKCDNVEADSMNNELICNVFISDSPMNRINCVRILKSSTIFKWIVSPWPGGISRNVVTKNSIKGNASQLLN